MRADGSISEAARGELREGDHAEFTLLERKNRDVKLDGAVLYTTLEPCAPGARQPGKLSCAERILNARIREVWVGIEDPDPTVDRQGIKHLQERGVTIHMFDADLQELIREENAVFIEEAENRAANARHEAEPVRSLRSIADAPSRAAMAALDPTALRAYYRSMGDISTENDVFRVRNPWFLQVLEDQGILIPDGETHRPTQAGLILFGSEPRRYLPQAGLLATFVDPNGREEIRDFEGPLVLLPPELEQWLRPRLPSRIDRNSAVRRDRDVPYELVRETVLNALIHRDYSIAGAKVQLVLSSDSLVIRSPGVPVEPITIDQMQRLEAPTLSRNPVIHFVMKQMAYAEERGLGMKSMRNLPRELDLPAPTFTWNAPYLDLTLYLTPWGALEQLEEDVRESMTARAKMGWTYLSSITDPISRSQYQQALQISERQAQRDLQFFMDAGMIEKSGRGPATLYKRITGRRA